MIDVQPPPVSAQDAARGVLPWLISVVLAIGAALWAAFRAKDAKLVGSLEARIEEQTKQYDALKATSDATIVKLGEKLDKQRDEAAAVFAAQQQERINDAKRTAKLLLQVHLQSQSRERPKEWEEAPTGVRDFLEIYEAGADARRDPDSIQPPRRPQRPR